MGDFRWSLYGEYIARRPAEYKGPQINSLPKKLRQRISNIVTIIDQESTKRVHAILEKWSLTPPIPEWTGTERALWPLEIFDEYEEIYLYGGYPYGVKFQELVFEEAMFKAYRHNGIVYKLWFTHMENYRADFENALGLEIIVPPRLKVPSWDMLIPDTELIVGKVRCYGKNTEIIKAPELGDMLQRYALFGKRWDAEQ